jgi:hypothetical protein
MLKQEITYKDYNDPPQTHTEHFYFNLTEREIAKMETMPSGGLSALLTRLAEAKDLNQMIEHVEEIVLSAVGVRSDDGKSFVKVYDDGRLVRDWFEQHAAYDVLFMKMWGDDKFVVQWMAGTFPSEYAPQVEAAAQNAIAEMGPGDADRNPSSGISSSPPPAVPPTV